MTFHPYHMVQPSPWPLINSFSSFILLSNMILLFCIESSIWLIMSILLLLSLNSYLWWRDIVREACFQGYHNSIVKLGLKLGMILFIVSEIMFFFSFFWTYFHSSLSPDLELELLWPPKGILSFNPYNIPFLNTMILLSSGIFVTWAHHSILNSSFQEAFNSLTLTILLGCYFTMLQGFEYNMSSYSMNDSTFGSIFFVATGFHGLHVIIGTTFLLVSLVRLWKNHFSQNHHFGFEAAAWYWHFVDVVWLFLYVFVYWWSY